MDGRLRTEYERIVEYYGGHKEFFEVNFDSLKRTKENHTYFDFIRSRDFVTDKGVFFYGRAGVGKTHLMKAKFNELMYWKTKNVLEGIPTGGSPYWVKCSVYLQAIKEKNYKIRNKAMESRWLFFDDLGTKFESWNEDDIFQLIDRRLESRLQTYITSNDDMESLGKKYHERVSSRIAQLCHCLEMKGVDLRVQESKKETINKIQLMRT